MPITGCLREGVRGLPVSIGFYIAALLVGAGIVVQQAINADLRAAVGSPYRAGLISFAVGTAALALVVLVLRQPAPALQNLVRVPWYSWLGGLLGVGFVVGGILLVPRLGAATVIALFIAGQLLTSLAVDQVGLLGVAVHTATWPRLAGAGLLIVGVALVCAF